MKPYVWAFFWEFLQPGCETDGDVREEKHETQHQVSTCKILMFLLVWHAQVFSVQGLKLELPVERDDCADVLDGLRSDLWGDTRRVQDHKYTRLPESGPFQV